MKFTSSSPTRRFGVLAAAAAMSLSLVAVAPAAAAIPTGPSDNTFYAPAQGKYWSGKPGDVVWKRAAQPATTLSNASQSITVVYKSKSLANKMIPVSGTVWLPKGTAPAGGWPIISWGHGTTGSADICAPSRITDTVSGSYTSYVFPSINTWLGKGYAVAMSDYEGLGTPGQHPWLIGPSEGRGMIDIVKAARKLSPSVSKNWVSTGHSQGGHASLFAASLAKSWGTGLNLKGVMPYAPANNMKATVLFAAGAIPGPSSLSGLGALLVRSLKDANPTIDLATVMNTGPYSKLPEIEKRCLGELGSTDYFGQYSPQQLLKGWNTSAKDWRDNPQWGRLVAALDGSKINPTVTVPTGIKIQMFQGGADSTVPAFTTNALLTQLRGKNTGSGQVNLTGYPSADHGGVVAAALEDANAFLLSSFGR
ncbi:MAG: lipase family protein [Actinomycetes bacterium]